MRFKAMVERPWWDTDDIGEELVKKYLKEIRVFQKEIKAVEYGVKEAFFVGEEVQKQVRRALEREAELCEFYLAFLKRERKGELNKWVFKENHKINDWARPTDRYEYTTGKVKSVIEIDKSSVMTKITLYYKNDSGIAYLNFSRYEHETKIESKHLKSEKSIKSYIEELKQISEETLKGFQEERWSEEKRNMDFLKKLLHISEVGAWVKPMC